MSTVDILVACGYTTPALLLALAWWRISRTRRMPDEQPAAEPEAAQAPVWDADGQQWATVHDVGADALRLLTDLEAHLKAYGDAVRPLRPHHQRGGLVNIIINPGSGPVDGANEANAHTAIRQFVNDLRARGITVVDMRQPGLDSDGRYGFALTSDALPNGAAIEVEMPGLPIDRVRYMDEGGQNIWDFPRLYVDGSSWVWVYALSVVVDAVRGGDQ